jgi:hypothetical protein
MKSVKSPQTHEWNTEEAARLAREAYRYVAEPLGVADRRVLECQERGDFGGYVEALRELCRVARREAQRKAA